MNEATVQRPPASHDPADRARDAASPRPFDEQEQQILQAVDTALQSGTELLRWWREEEASGYATSRRYKQSFVANRPEDRSFGFFANAPLTLGNLPVNGNVQHMFYDEPKSASPSGGKTADWMNQQIQEFVLHYFMRISDYRQPQQIPPEHLPAPPLLSVFSNCPSGRASLEGFGFIQKLFKRRDGQVGRFRTAEQTAIIDLRRLDDAFDWIVLRNPIFDFSFEIKPFGSSGPQLVLPLSEFNFLVTSKDFIINDTDPKEEGIIGRYGFGYAFIRSRAPSPLAYGPGQLEPAFELLVWDVHSTGEVTVRAIFAANQPEGVLNLSLDPITWTLELTDVVFGSPQVKSLLAPFRRFYESLPGSNFRVDPVFPAIDLLNAFTLGQASRRFCISREQIMREFLFLHFQQHYATLLGSLQTWRQVRDWLNEADIPDFARDGRPD